MFAIIKAKFKFKHGLGFLGLVVALVWLVIFSFPDNRLHLVFCDVGQGDATLIRKGFAEILIDGGPNDKVLQCLANNLPFFDKTIEIVILTHPEADHLTGLLAVLDKYQVDYFLSGPEGNNSAIFAELYKKLKIKNQNEKLKIKNVYRGDEIKLGEIHLDSFWPERQWVAERIGDENNPPSQLTSHPHPAILGAKTSHTKLNDFSLVFLLQYAGKKVLLMGDADSQVQDKITGLQELVNSQDGVDILKFPHHGSKTGMKEDFLEKIKTEEAVISVGKNSYGHPTSETLDMLKRFNVTIRRTDLEGDIKYVY